MYLVQAQNCKLLLQTVYIFNKFKIVPVKKILKYKLLFYCRWTFLYKYLISLTNISNMRKTFEFLYKNN